MEVWFGLVCFGLEWVVVLCISLFGVVAFSPLLVCSSNVLVCFFFIIC